MYLTVGKVEEATTSMKEALELGLQLDMSIAKQAEMMLKNMMKGVASNDMNSLDWK